MRSGRILAAGLLLAAACAAGSKPQTGGAAGSKPQTGGAAAPAVVPADWKLDYRLEGGIAAFDVSFEVGADGRASYRRNRPEPRAQSARLGAEEVEALGRLVVESGFLDLAGPYRPEVAVADAFLYTLRWQAGGRVHQVSASDGVELPRAFVQVREAVAGLERKVLAQAGRGESQAGGEGK